MVEFPRSRSLSLAGLAACVAMTVTPVWAQYQVLDDGAGQYWSVMSTNGDLELSGSVPFASVAEILNSEAGTDQDLAIAEGAPRGFLPDAIKAIEVARLLEQGSVAYGAQGWIVSGTLRDDADPQAFQALAIPSASGVPWAVQIDSEETPSEPQTVSNAVLDGVQSLFGSDEPEDGTGTEGNIDPDAVVEPSTDEPEQTQSPASAVDASPLPVVPQVDPIAPQSSEPVIDEAAIQACRVDLNELMANETVLFSSGSARLTASSQTLLSEVAEILQTCPETPVYVEGHTDSDGGAQANLVLSLSRAESVVDVLVELGLPPRRLYAVGYGASLPIASNDTATGKAQNRRIVFNFEDIAAQEGNGQ